MKVPRQTIAAIVADKAATTKQPKRLSREIAAYLLSERRVSELAPLLRDVQQDWADAGFVEVTAVSAHPLSTQVRRDITARMHKLYPGAKRVGIIEEIDSSIVGGVRLELANEQLDLSIEAKLNKFKQLTVGKD